jgi:hypothetical protein
MTALVYGIVRSADAGWGDVLALALALALVVALIVRPGRTTHHPQEAHR